MARRASPAHLPVARTRTNTIVGRALIVWVVLMLVEVVHGIVRRLLLTPTIGDRRARQVGVAVGSALIVGITIVYVRWLQATSRRSLLTIGAAWAALTVRFEVLVGIATGASAERIWSDYDLRRGGLMPLGLLVEFLSPYPAARMRGIATSGCGRSAAVAPPPGSR